MAEESVFDIVAEAAEKAAEKAKEAAEAAAEKATSGAAEVAKKGVERAASFLKQRREEAAPTKVLKEIYNNVRWDTYWLTVDRVSAAVVWFLAAAVVWALYYLYIRAIAGLGWRFQVFNFTVTFEVGRYLAAVDYLYTPAHLAMILSAYSFMAFVAGVLLGALRPPYWPRKLSVMRVVRATLYYMVGYLLAPLAIAPILAYVVAYLFSHPAGYIIGLIASLAQTLLGAVGGLSLLSALALIPLAAVLLVLAVLAAVAIFMAMFTCSFLASSLTKMLEATRLQALIVGLLVRLVFRPPLAWLGVVGAWAQYVAAFVLALYAVYAGIAAAAQDDWGPVMNLPGLALVWYMARTGAAGVAVLRLADAVAVAYGQLFSTPGAQLAVTAARFIFAWFF